ncbi:MAG: hypothetical protein KGL95_09670, partial [Patescibacteria group bacterium]|nr:hypothetical protein [Patescibacteria group bacterium]
KYKAGQRVLIRLGDSGPSNASKFSNPTQASAVSMIGDFYVTAVDHEFQWGTGIYKTALTLVRGQFPGILSGISPTGIVDNSAVNAFIQNSPVLNPLSNFRQANG